ncbi:hypothetical protein HNQ81_002400 [Desulfoprunum benzoelyticum]|uniref:Uncharacterized protein n=1 Tax=Desulfoprunum benzoelyticum TaxID=1506996 RepID=A0A840V461_9BACT|nr:hypothetical protein [Desulfoprunum benzoelyticum]MBB5348660.1 hypothetical protein [Desulfoprunum benzoelyticum]
MDIDLKHQIKHGNVVAGISRCLDDTRKTERHCRHVELFRIGRNKQNLHKRITCAEHRGAIGDVDKAGFACKSGENRDTGSVITP